MADSTPSTIEFIQYHQPALEDGDYEITLKQSITAERVDDTFSVTRRFSVAGPRFALNPQDVQAVFPPAGSLGDHDNVLPHILLARSTLPWERRAHDGDPTVPWLLLLLFGGDEAPTPATVTLQQLQNTAGYAAHFPAIEREVGQHADDSVTIIDVPRRTLAHLLPTRDDLALMAHVRVSSGDAGGAELAVVIGNRLPPSGGESVAHLVSVEGRYGDAGFDYQGAGEDDLIRLVSLYSWRFACRSHKHSFKGLLEHLNREPATLRLANRGHETVDHYLAMGCVPLQYTLRDGNTTVGWYHGPLLPAEHTDAPEQLLPARVADGLLRFDPETGTFDVSYAAAWELGRLLSLQNKQVSIDLHRWKQAHKQTGGRAEQRLLHPHLYYHDDHDAGPALPPVVADWFAQLRRLAGVPFTYLLPDDTMLPAESLRVFWVDRFWVDCVIDGAFSVGRVTDDDHAHDVLLAGKHLGAATETVTGLLLRSQVVAGWPDLLVDAYDAVVANTDFVPEADDLDLLRMVRLGPDTLLCLFAGEIQSVDIHQKPEVLHFGVSRPDETHSTYYKILRTAAGTEIDSSVSLDQSWHWKEGHVFAMRALATAVTQSQKPLSDQFALEMIEGVQKVRFSMMPAGE